MCRRSRIDRFDGEGAGLTEEKLRSLQSEYSAGSYKVGIGADAIRELLRKIDINAKWDEIKAKAKTLHLRSDEEEICEATESH